MTNQSTRTQDRTKYRTCPTCGKRSLYLSDAFFYVCELDDCDEHVWVEEFIDDEPELYDIDGDKIVY